MRPVRHSPRKTAIPPPMLYPLDRTSADPSQLPTSKSASKIYVRPLFCLCIRFCITGDCISVPFSLFSLVCLGPNLSTGRKDCLEIGRIGKQIFMNNNSANGRQESIRHNCKFPIVIDNVIRYRLLEHFPTLSDPQLNFIFLYV